MTRPIKLGDGFALLQMIEAPSRNTFFPISWQKLMDGFGDGGGMSSPQPLPDPEALAAHAAMIGASVRPFL